MDIVKRKIKKNYSGVRNTYRIAVFIDIADFLLMLS